MKFSKIPRHVLENPILLEGYMQAQVETSERRKKRREDIYNTLKEYSIGVAKDIGKWTAITVGALTLAFLGSSLIPHKKDLAEILKKEQEISATIRQAEYQIGKGNLDKAQKLYQETINLIPDNNLGKNYKGNIEKQILAFKNKPN